MRTVVNSKRLQIGFVLCSLLLLECLNLGIISLAPFGSSGMNGPAAAWSSDASRSSKVYAELDVMGAVRDGALLNMTSAGKMRGLGFKNNHFFSGVLSAASLAGLIYYLSLSREIYNIFDSLQITNYLHKKDGMK